MSIRGIALCALSWLLFATPAIAQQASAGQAGPAVVDLWPQGALTDNPVRGPERVGQDGNGIGAVSNISRPRMEIYKPAQPNGTAVLILGGGGYFRIQIANESRPVAEWLAAMGVTPVILYYRLPVDGWKAEAPFQDAQRALRLLRSHAADHGIDPQRIGVLGLSAGGHLAAIAETRFDTDFYQAVDEADKISSRPDFSALIYPVVSLQPPYDTTRTRRELGMQKDAVEAYSAEKHVTKATPPTFIVHAADDPIAKVGHSLLMFSALREHGVAAELHVFESGGHGWTLGRPGTLAASWPRLFALWARQHRLLDQRPILPPSMIQHAPRAPAANRADDRADDPDDHAEDSDV